MPLMMATQEWQWQLKVMRGGGVEDGLEGAAFAFESRHDLSACVLVWRMWGYLYLESLFGGGRKQRSHNIIILVEVQKSLWG